MENNILKELSPILNCKVDKIHIDVYLENILLCRAIEKSAKIIHEISNPNTLGMIKVVKDDSWKTVMASIPVLEIENLEVNQTLNNQYKIKFLVKNVEYEIHIII